MPRQSQTDEQEKVFQSDHDVLLELRSDFRNFKEVVTGGLKGVQDSLDSQHAQMNARLIILETFVTKNNLEEKVRQWDSASSWVEIFRSRWKWMVAAVSLGSGILVYFIDHILPNIRFK